MGCCGSTASKEDPEQQEAKIRLSRANAISSSDAPSRGGGRSAKQRSIAEAAQAQEWCLENLGSELAERRPKQRPRERDKAKAQKRAAAEAAADGVNEHARQLGHLSGAALVERVMADGDGGDCERALAAALVMAERVQRDADEAGALVVGGALNLLLRTLERAEVQRSSLATHRCVHALRQILCAAPPELAAARAKHGAWLPRVIAGAMAAHATSGGLAQHASEALTALAATDAPAVRAAGALEAACAAMRECDDEPEVQLAGGELLIVILDGGGAKIASAAVDAGAIGALSRALKRHAARAPVATAALRACRLVLEQLAPPVASPSGSGGSGKGGGAAAARAVRQAARGSVPQLCHALLHEQHNGGGGKGDANGGSGGLYLGASELGAEPLLLLAACARCAGGTDGASAAAQQLLAAAEAALPDAALVVQRRGGFRAAAVAYCELVASLPPAAPPGEDVTDALLATMLLADERVQAAAAAALASLARRPRALADAHTRDALLEASLAAAQPAAATSSSSVAADAIAATRAVIENLPPDHAAAAAAALDEVALTTALGAALGGGAAAPSLLAALRLSELLVRVGGPTAAALRGGLPALEPRSLAAAMTGGSAHAARADVQEAFAALLCALIRRGGSPQQLEDAVRALLGAAAAHPQSAAIARHTCEAIGAAAAGSAPERARLREGGAALIAPLIEMLKRHAVADAAVAQAACWALRGLCAAPADAPLLAQLRRRGGGAALESCLRAHGARVKFCREILDALGSSGSGSPAPADDGAEAAAAAVAAAAAAAAAVPPPTARLAAEVADALGSRHGLAPMRVSWEAGS